LPSPREVTDSPDSAANATTLIVIDSESEFPGTPF